MQLPPSHADLLELFAEDERDECSFCREKARVNVPDAHATVCLVCGAICLNGERIDVDRRIAV